MFMTYYIQSSGQPVHHRQEHESLHEAIEMWRENCRALSRGAGGVSVLRDENVGHELIWADRGCGYAYGNLLDGDALGAEDLDSPEKVAAAAMRQAASRFEQVVERDWFTVQYH